MFPCDLPNTFEASRPGLPLTLTGGCHCGAVRYRITVRRWRVSECNCSICAKKGYLHVVVPKEDFELLSGADRISTYQFNTRIAWHYFCTTCGIHSFYVPRSHPDGFSVNARCLEAAKLSWFELEHFDGQHWENAIHELR